MSKINNDWKEILEEEFQKDYFVELKNILEKEYENYTVYPPKKDILNAFFLTPYSEVKVVLLGQDPYHQKGQAHGLAFSVNYGIKTPPSLLNMYKELHDDLGLYIPNNGFLEKWAKQGVLLLNTSLTVRDSEANSHSKIGWQTFTDNVIKKLNEREKPIIFILWGNNAKAKEKFIDTNKHYILKGAHPSPLSANRGFFGCKHFSEVNRILKELKEKGKIIVGICGGLQMLGKKIYDPKHLESDILETEGFNFFDYETTFDEIKKTEQVTKRLELTEGILKDFTNYEVKGYEIHQGISTFDSPVICKERTFATYIHGIFDNSKFTNDFLNIVRREKNMPKQKEIFSFNEFKEKEYDKLAELLRKNLDMTEIYKILEKK